MIIAQVELNTRLQSGIFMLSMDLVVHAMLTSVKHGSSVRIFSRPSRNMETPIHQNRLHHSSEVIEMQFDNSCVGQELFRITLGWWYPQKWFVLVKIKCSLWIYYLLLTLICLACTSYFPLVISTDCILGLFPLIPRRCLFVPHGRASSHLYSFAPHSQHFCLIPVVVYI